VITSLETDGLVNNGQPDVTGQEKQVLEHMGTQIINCTST